MQGAHRQPGLDERVGGNLQDIERLVRGERRALATDAEQCDEVSHLGDPGDLIGIDGEAAKEIETVPEV